MSLPLQPKESLFFQPEHLWILNISSQRVVSYKGEFDNVSLGALSYHNKSRHNLFWSCLDMGGIPSQVVQQQLPNHQQLPNQNTNAESNLPSERNPRTLDLNKRALSISHWKLTPWIETFSVSAAKQPNSVPRMTVLVNVHIDWHTPCRLLKGQNICRFVKNVCEQRMVGCRDGSLYVEEGLGFCVSWFQSLLVPCCFGFWIPKFLAFNVSKFQRFTKF